MRKLGAYPIYLLLSGTLSLGNTMLWAVETVYLVNAVGLNPVQIVLVGTVLLCVHLLFQTPTGILADMYSRRLAVVVGLFVLGAGHLVEGAQASYLAVLAGTVIGSFGYTMVSGADAAWIADELGAEQVGNVYLRAAQVGALAGLPGIALGAVLGSMRLNVPILLSGCVFIALGLVLLLVMPEQHFTPADRAHRTARQHMRHTLRAGVHRIRLRPALLTILGSAVCASVFSSAFDRLWGYHLLAHFNFPSTGGLTLVAWFGLIEASINVANLCGTEIARRCVDWEHRRSLIWGLCAVDALTLAFVVGFALAGQLGPALGLFWLAVVSRSPREALETTWMNLDLEASVRATVFSMREQAGALAGIIAGPLLGALATDRGTGVALIASAAALAPALVLYRRSLGRGGPPSPPSEAPAQSPKGQLER
jgi:DHA3 family tetracycline resistance protein-like MFS transporter